jgi:hypothetical protein
MVEAAVRGALDRHVLGNPDGAVVEVPRAHSAVEAGGSRVLERLHPRTCARAVTEPDSSEEH